MNSLLVRTEKWYNKNVILSRKYSGTYVGFGRWYFFGIPENYNKTLYCSVLRPPNQWKKLYFRGRRISEARKYNSSYTISSRTNVY